jgi:CubicO group peptidase (beta-lactamase class C family)
MMINRGVYKGRRILKEENIELMEKCHIELPYQTFGNDAYGYGWMIHPNFFSKKLVGHGGSVLTHNTYVAYIPEEKIGVVVLSNVAGYSPSYMGFYALSLLMNEEPEKLPFLKYENNLKKLQGRYETYKGTMKYSVVKKGDYLFIEYKDKFSESSIPLFFEKEEGNMFIFSTISSGRRIKVEFKVDETGIWMLLERYRFKKV